MKKLGGYLFAFLLLLAGPLSAQTPGTDSLFAVLKKELPDTERVNTHNRLSVAYRSSDNELCKKHAKEAMTLAEEIDFPAGMADAYENYGIAVGNEGLLEEEIGWHQKALELYVALGDVLGQGKSTGNMGIDEYMLGDYKSAVEHSLQAMDHYEKSGYMIGVVSTNMTLGNISLEQKNRGEALRYYSKALEIAQKSVHNELMEARIRANIGNVYNEKNDDEKALEYYQLSLPVFERNNALHEKAVMLNNIGTIYEERGENEKALSLYREGLAIRVNMNDRDGICSAYQNIGNALVGLGRLDSALHYQFAALDIATAMNMKSQEVTCYRNIADIYAHMKKFGEAYAYLDRYTSMNDSLVGSENSSAISELKDRYANEKHQRRIDQMETAGRLAEEESTRNIVILVAVLLGVAIFAIILYNRSRMRRLVNEQLAHQNMEITMQKKAITDSINYAKKIQDSILPPQHHIDRVLPDSFILYEPKDVVSGDFYWLEKHKGLSIFAAVDCTGHGVPGALMSVVGFNLLNQAVNEMGLTKPSDILHHLDYGVNKLLRQSDGGNSVKDGMDLALCTFDRSSRTLQYAGVFNPAYIVRQGELIQVKADKFPIGINVDGVTDNYTNQTIQLGSGDMIYLFSDGYADQFGGPMGKKYKYTRFREFLLEICNKPVAEQRKALKAEFLSWKGAHEQVDDILVIGVRVN